MLAIVTGGASGIEGAESVKLFAQNGASVVIANVQDELGHQLAASLSPHPVSYRHVRDEKRVEQTITFAVDKHGRLDVMFSNAATAGSFYGILDLDLDACWAHGYMASKHALVGLVRFACCELGAHGIRENCVSPFAVATTLTCRYFNKGVDEVEAMGMSMAILKGIALKATQH